MLRVSSGVGRDGGGGALAHAVDRSGAIAKNDHGNRTSGVRQGIAK